MDTDPEAPREELASAQIDGPSNTEARVRKVFETRDPRVAPKPPGVTVRIVRLGSGFVWMYLELDGVSHDTFVAHSARQFATPEAAKADCREHLTELVARLLPDLEREDIEVVIKFVEE